ncbi:pro-neuregulin-3, membrane-bound isoform isoform X2 [Denticeps clupeoides]|uniref:pro-neuregulin-3, membrane-bound isoform isoform X2 n=1 Tax=Denticeps clupeoides TaxID=299321 RepID=UPI0010A2C4CE|nr:pro-neuregulin-3, membrane-bound isoform-like isoform X2 [Denticeps clupeoides]
MSDSSGAIATSGAMILEEVEGGGASGGRDQAPAREHGPLRCGSCTLWPRQQTWLCVVPLLIGFIGLGLSLMLLKWIVVGSVRDYVPTDLVNAKGIGQDPIFLSKPSAFPKGSDTTTTAAATHTPSSTITSTTSTTTTIAVVRSRTRSGTHSVSTTTGRGGSSGSQATQRSTTTRLGSRTPHITVAATTSTLAASSTSSPKPSNPTVLHDSTQMWTHEHTTENPATTPTRMHVSRKTPSPTLPPLRSEHFKQCHEKDLAYCLNDGECFVIETLTGPHKHCRCKEGFQGIRCDQFLPKTDSILSDPTDHLGIEFMESTAVYKRQLLSSTCIALGISLLGTLCVALYCRNKRRREKLQNHLKESRSLKNYSFKAPGLKSNLRPHVGLQLQNVRLSISYPFLIYPKGSRPCSSHGGTTCDSHLPSQSRCCSAGRHHSGSLSHSPDQRSRTGSRIAPRKTPPISRGRLNPIGGQKDSGPAYHHLQEVESSERDMESVNGHISDGGSDLRQDSFLNMQPSLIGSEMDVHSCHQDPKHVRLIKGLPAYRTCSVPIIPSVQGNRDDSSYMQTSTVDSSGSCSITVREVTLARRPSPQTALSPPTGSASTKVALLLEEAQDQLRALAHTHRKQDDHGGAVPQVARETVCVLLSSGASVGGVALSGPTETQLLSPRDVRKGLAQPCQ